MKYKSSLIVLTIMCVSVFVNAAPCHFQLFGDLDNNCKVDIADLGLLAQAWLVNCDVTPADSLCIPLDLDGDGFDASVDCDDDEPSVFPGAPEIINDGIDQDCDGIDQVPELLNMAWVYIDDSGEGMVDMNGLPLSKPGFKGEMSAYETTNSQYCQFLNDSLLSGDISLVGNVVYGADGSNGGADFVGQMYIDLTYDPANFKYSEIIYSGGVFIPIFRDGYDMSDHPVVMVTWYGATALCNYYGYSLPTEWQWQAVADYDGSYMYGCGLVMDLGIANYWYDIIDDYYSNPLNLTSKPYTSPVYYYPAAGYGMHDMAGNLWEWTSSPQNGYPVIRGGAWNSDDWSCDVSFSVPLDPNEGWDTVGFRVCRNVEPIGITWVQVNDPGVDDNGDGTPDHEPFNGEISKYETTNAQYCKFLNQSLASGDIYLSDEIVYGAAGSNSGADFVDQIYYVFRNDPFYGHFSQIVYQNGKFSVITRDGWDMSDHPVVMVSWYGATAFCNYYGYRLPTEWQWQAIADYDGSYIYGCGTTISVSKANYGSANPFEFSIDPLTSSVDYYPAYGYGVNDMAGNVWEWTSSMSAQPGWAQICDGSYILSETPVSNRFDGPLDYTDHSSGFRVCR